MEPEVEAMKSEKEKAADIASNAANKFAVRVCLAEPKVPFSKVFGAHLAGQAIGREEGDKSGYARGFARGYKVCAYNLESDNPVTRDKHFSVCKCNRCLCDCGCDACAGGQHYGDGDCYVHTVGRDKHPQKKTEMRK